MKISEAAKRSGLAAKTIRYYESVGLVESVRADNGYRIYTEQAVSEMTFLYRARHMGFSLAQCHELLELFRNPSRASRSVRTMAEERLDQVNRQIEQLKELKNTLGHLIQECPGDDHSDCVILDELSGQKQTEH